MLKDKIKHSIELLKRGEKLALSLSEQGYFVAFSGGKDSQVMLDLVKKSGVKYVAYYSVTSNDPPENVYFIREKYPEVVFIHPEKNYYKLISEKGLPTVMKRYCCERMKERLGVGMVVLTGVRAEESRKRAAYSEFAVVSRRKENIGVERTLEEVTEAEHQCIKGKDKVMLRPILQWTERDIWSYIYSENIPVNPCYNLVGRVGCMFCPFSSKANIALYEQRYPRFRALIIRSLERYLDNCRSRGSELLLGSAEEYYQWWKSKKSIEEYLRRR